MKFKYPFLELLHDFGHASQSLALVGGWVPTVYFEYLWHIPIRHLFTTIDINFGVPKDFPKNKLGQLMTSKIIKDLSVDFIADTEFYNEIIAKEFEPKISLRSFKSFEFLLEHTLHVNCDTIQVNVPEPARYIMHKILVYLENRVLRKKDLAVAYLCLSRSPDAQNILKSIESFHELDITKNVKSFLSPLCRDKNSSAVKDIRSSLGIVGLQEREETIFEVLSNFVEALS